MEKATCENCDNFDNCPVVQFEAPETCGNYEGDYEIIDDEYEVDPFKDFLNN